MNKKCCILALILIILLGGLILLYFGLSNKCDNSKKEDNSKIEIVKYELQTHEYYQDKVDKSKYYIDSKEELNAFYNLYSDALKVNENILDNNTIFVEVKEVGSGSIKYELKDVLIDDTVIFKLDSEEPEIGTDDMAFWYFVAIIPNNVIKDIKLDEWVKPSSIKKDISYEFKLDSNNKYEVTTDLKFETLLNDGGSYTSSYYQIDLDNNKVVKIIENYKANLGGTPETSKKVEYTKDINNDLNKEIKTLLDSLMNSEDINDSTNYHCYTIKVMNNSKDIYNTESINKLKDIINKIDLM